MKEFEKWWQDNMPKDMRYESAYHKALLYDGWKAALKWILKEINRIDGVTGEREHWMGEFIEEELK